MSYLDLVQVVKGDYKESKDVAGRYTLTTENDLKQFKNMLQIDNSYFEGLKKTDSFKEFYEAYELFEKTFDPKLQEDIFYSTKLGFFFEGVPSRLVYLLKKAIDKNPTPSLALQSISVLAWDRFLKKGSLPEDITIKDVLDAIYGYETKLIDELQLRVRHESFSEIYVKNVDRICLLPNAIADQFDLKDLDTLEYVPKQGVCFDGVPVRFFDGRNGITLDEFDMRDI